MRKLLWTLLLWMPCLLFAETGREAWLRYEPVRDAAARARYDSLPATMSVLGHSPVLGSARDEMIRGIRGMLGRTLRIEKNLPEESSIILGTVQSVKRALPALALPAIGKEGYWIGTAELGGQRHLIVASPDDRGVLYGVFGVLHKIGLGQSIAPDINEIQQPSAPIRWVNHWDNLDGTIERGYAGPSIFFEKDNVRENLSRVSEYGRLLASIGVNGITINNVNANPRVVQDDFIPQVARIADAFRPWGIQVAVSVDLSSPRKIGAFETFDPLDPRISAWWQQRVDRIYERIPDFGGFTVKADSEGRSGPSSYGRTPADAANMLARTLKPHGGVLFYRAFVYDHHADWRNLKNDRARAAYDIFRPLDGAFEDNVIIQIKHGPIDFQIREPVSPLFGGLEKTSAAVELPVMQEYTGQQWHLCFLMPYWKELLDFDLQAKGAGTPLKAILSGKTFHRSNNGYVAVVNVGLDDNWLGHPMGMSNLYGYGRLAWNPDLSPETIAAEWARLTFGSNPKVVQTTAGMLLTSWEVYENYTGPLGAQTLTDIVGSHFGPGVEASERNGWGQWHRADGKGMGMDRAVATGTGYAGQYSAPVARVYESPETTPDALLLWFHHVPYTYRLKSGKSVIQHIYDSHYAGAEQAEKYVDQWRGLEGFIDEQRFGQTLERLEFQAGHARVWRDAVCNFFHNISGIADSSGRIGDYPDRIEAESMRLNGYASIDIVPWENASGGKGIECRAPAGCSAAFRFERSGGWYDLDIEYFDLNTGASKYRLYLNSQLVDEWDAERMLMAWKPGGDSSSRRRLKGLALRAGDEIRIEGIPDKGEFAGLDFVRIHH